MLLRICQLPLETSCYNGAKLLKGEIIVQLFASVLSMLSSMNNAVLQRDDLPENFTSVLLGSLTRRLITLSAGLCHAPLGFYSNCLRDGGTKW